MFAIGRYLLLGFWSEKAETYICYCPKVKDVHNVNYIHLRPLVGNFIDVLRFLKKIDFLITGRRYQFKN